MVIKFAVTWLLLHSLLILGWMIFNVPSFQHITENTAPIVIMWMALSIIIPLLVMSYPSMGKG